MENASLQHIVSPFIFFLNYVLFSSEKASSDLLYPPICRMPPVTASSLTQIGRRSAEYGTILHR
jgi:hypothetical protein